MIILLKMLVVLLLMVFLLHRQAGIGNAMLAAALLLFLLTSPKPENLFSAIRNTLEKPGTWILVITLYLVMCLEHILRTSGILKEFTVSARKMFRSDRVLLGFMPAFLGFLPSLGGAIFSAPLVKEAGSRYSLSPERSTAINYWFRHVWEFINPILPAILLASELTRVPLGTLIANQYVFTLMAITFGILVLLTGKSFKQSSEPTDKKNPDNQFNFETLAEKPSRSYRYVLLAAGPIIVNVLLVVIFNLNTALSMGLVILGMTAVLGLDKEKLRSMLVSSFDYKIQWGIINIIFFQEILFSTGTIDQITAVFRDSGIPIEAVIGLAAFSAGLLTGGPQGFVAVVFPIIAALSHGNLDLIAVGYVTGLAGVMCSPAHLCLLVSIEYFRADFFKSILPIILLEIMMVFCGLLYIMIF